MPDEVRVFAPATVANLGLGFDVLGLAVNGAGDTVTARRVSGESITITRITGDDGRLPTAADENTAGVAAAATLKRAGLTEGVGLELELEKGLPLGSGLGSSGASAAAAACAVNLLLGSPLRKTDLVLPCVAAEEVVAGRHADNVAPSLLGGLILVRSLEPLEIVRLPQPEGLCTVVVTPKFELPTKKAREVVPQQVPLGALVRNTANIAALVSALYSGDFGLLARCITDEIIAPARAGLIPGCMEVIGAALEAGALGSSISGAGPSIFALCRSERSAEEVAVAMEQAFEKAGLETTKLISVGECPGASRR